ncbi:MAG: efflux RND transporter periplasmic adaptor subunit [Chroococcidiopsidaceae cyanobacterium CP_BM_ER_R8_30]|nr:efflux RND transporter periplasmic adaptor subunit [Chroococcidiopsidaceae cyanobacterium CP_BM_ER_R8_30]
MKINRLSQLFIAILALSLLGSCGRAEPSANAGKPPSTKVKLATLQTSTVISSAEFIGSLFSRRSVNLQSQVVGHVTKILVKYGENVSAGTEMLEVDPDQQRATVNSYKAAAQAAQANLKSAEATLSQYEAQRLANLSSVNYNRKQYDRYTYLASQGAVPLSTRDQYADQIRQAQANLAAIDKQIQAQRFTIAQQQKNILQAQANTQQQQVQLGYYKITAPFAGTVGDIPVKIGDYVTTSTTLTTVTQNQPLEVNVSIPIEDAPRVHQGTTVELLDPQGKTIGPSQVFFIAPSTDNSTQSVLIKSLYANSNNQLRASQYVRARVIWDQRPGVLVPTTAVSRIGGESFVYVAQTKTVSQGQDKPAHTELVARQKPVQLGDIQGNSYQVISGLQPGEKLVTSGILNLSDGTPIAPES